MKHKLTTLIIVLILMLTLTGTALAQEVELLPCEGDTLTGTVIDVDEETGTVTVEDEDGNQCTTTLNGDYDHPITTLLAAYFNEANAEDLRDALDATSVCAVYDAEPDTWRTVEVAEG